MVFPFFTFANLIVLYRRFDCPCCFPPHYNMIDAFVKKGGAGESTPLLLRLFTYILKFVF